jgi:hypothetical protein
VGVAGPHDFLHIGTMRKALKVATLLGHAHVEMAIACLGSLLRYSAEPVHLRIHEDGTLTANDRARLEAGLDRFEFIPRAEADKRMADLLGGRPALRAFRQASPFALKVIDIPLLANGSVAYCDTDVLFLRPFTGLFRFPGPEVGAIFMSDHQNAYSLRSWQLLRHPRLRLPSRVNTGIFHVRTRCFDPDLLEWFLSRPEFGFTPWVEQTAWALLGARAGCRLWDPRMIRTPSSGEEASREAVALHFVTPLRGLLPWILQRAQNRTAEPPLMLETVPARPCRPWDLGWTELRRRWQRHAR